MAVAYEVESISFMMGYRAHPTEEPGGIYVQALHRNRFCYRLLALFVRM